MTLISRSRVWLWLVGIALVVAGVLLLIAVIPLRSERVRQRLVATLSDRLESDVDLASLHVRLFPHFHVGAEGLVIRHKGRRDVPPLIAVKALTIEASLVDVLRKHVRLVTLDGLEISIPPDRDRDKDDGRPERSISGDATANRDMKTFVVDTLVSSDARLVIIPRDPDKYPKVWAIHDLTMRSVGLDRPMPFDATLTNAVPPGEIGTRGSFGPWRADTPGLTPIEGTFTFAKADLSVFKGISGILSAHGEFGGSLGRLGVHGETDTPQFTVGIGGHPVPLHTDYHATVDGTNGDTVLDQIDGSFLRTSLVAKGRVVDTPGKHGRTVTLDITMDRARLEDVLLLATKPSRPAMTGALKLKTKFVLPPGERDVADKLQLDGQFSIATAKFTNIDVQTKINELSHRSRGKAPSLVHESVVSNFRGHFRLRDAVLALRGLMFETPGAQVRLAGTYSLRPELLDFKGTLAMNAKLSDTQAGFKRLLLKVVDPLFKGDGGGSVIPIKIQGTRNEPSFGLDKGRVFKRGS